MYNTLDSKLSILSVHWEPYLQLDITAIDKVQRSAVCYVMSNYSWRGSVTTITQLALS